MTAKWVEGYSPDLLCRRLENAKAVDTVGKVSFQGFEFTSNIVVLSSMVSLSTGISELEKKRIITKATFKVAGQGSITPESILLEINSLEKQYLKEAPKKYVLITSLSVQRFLKLKRQSVNGCTITFTSTVPYPFRKEAEKVNKHATHSICGELPKDYLVVRIAVAAKSHSEAADRAIDAIDLFRGIWNLFYNRRNVHRMSSGQRQPVNKILLGPIHTLHLPNAKLATESWWYEPDYRGPLKTLEPARDVEEFCIFQSRVSRLLKKSPFRTFLESAIVRYTRALDLQDWNSAFLNLWSLLEGLTNTGDNDTHKVTVKRTSFLFQDREYVKQILTHLKDHRNRAVHTGSGNENIETLMYQLKNFVESALEFLLGNKFGLKNLGEVAQFLDLPDGKTALMQRIKLLESALKYTKA